VVEAAVAVADAADLLDQKFTASVGPLLTRPVSN
jgi:hypothetical protein